MPTYAPIPQFADRRAAPKTLTLIVAAHAVAIAAVMTAKMEIIPVGEPPTIVDTIPLPKAPPPNKPPERQDPPKPIESALDQPLPIIPTLLPTRPDTDATPVLPNPGPTIDTTPLPNPDPIPLPQPVRTGPRFTTPDWAIKPPYPEEKRRTEEEAVLKLKLTIDARGRVVMVEPVGRADPVFLAAARKHLLAHWRYKPATEDGRAIASATVVALRFELED